MNLAAPKEWGKVLTKRGNSLSRYILIGKTDSELNNFPLWELPQLINHCWLISKIRLGPSTSVDCFSVPHIILEAMLDEVWGETNKGYHWKFFGAKIITTTGGGGGDHDKLVTTVNIAWWMDCKTKGIVDDLTLAWLSVRMPVDSSARLIVTQSVSVLDHHWSQRSPIGDDTPPLFVLQNTRNSWYCVTQCYEMLVCILIGIPLFWYQLVVIFFC